MNSRYIAVIVVFVAIISVCSAFAHMIAWVGHPTIGAVVVTFLYLTSYGITGKLGVPTVIGLLVGIINGFIFGSPLAPVVHLVRGGIFDLYFFLSRHKLCCKKCVVTSGMLSFYGTMIVIFALYTFFGLPFTSWWIWFIVVGIPSTLLTVPGSLLALKYRQTLRKIALG